MSDSMVRFDVALIGVGNWGSILKKYFEEDMRFNLKYVCNSKSNLDEVFEDSDVEMVVIATPDETHAELVLKALNYNKHVFCEKPLALRYLQTSSIRVLARERERVVVTDYIYTFSKALKKIQQLIKSGKVGELKRIQLISKQSKRKEGENVYWVLGSHMLSILDMFIPIETCLFKILASMDGMHQLNTIIIESNSGVGANIEISLDHSEKDRRMIFSCDKTTLFFDAILGKIKIVYNDEFVNIIEYDERQNVKLALDNLYDCLIGKNKDNLDMACSITEIFNRLGI